MRIGFCPNCRAFRDDPREPFGSCDCRGNLLHETKCDTCDFVMYFQTDDDYCGPEKPIICGACARKMTEEPDEP